MIRLLFKCRLIIEILTSMTKKNRDEDLPKPYLTDYISIHYKRFLCNTKKITIIVELYCFLYDFFIILSRDIQYLVYFFFFIFTNASRHLIIQIKEFCIF